MTTPKLENLFAHQTIPTTKIPMRIKIKRKEDTKWPSSTITSATTSTMLFIIMLLQNWKRKIQITIPLKPPKWNKHKKAILSTAAITDKMSQIILLPISILEIEKKITLFLTLSSKRKEEIFSTLPKKIKKPLLFVQIRWNRIRPHILV